MQRTLLASLLFTFTFSANATDGQILITHAKAMAGNVTPGDTPGYPVTISKSGSYVLGGDLNVNSLETSAIQINASNVSIDLNGFGIYGPNSCTVGLMGYVTACPSGDGFGIVGINDGNSVRNGVIQGMGYYAINLGSGAEVDGVLATHNGGTGIVLSSGQVRNSRSRLNGGSGIYIQDEGLAIGNTVKGNYVTGIMLGTDGLATGNNITRNRQVGITTISTGVGYSNNVINTPIGGSALGGSPVDLGGNLIN